MKNKTWIWIAAILLTGSLASADDVTGAKALLCAGTEAIVCNEYEGCESGPPWNWNIPSFIKFDLEGKELSTTEASGERRVTPIKSIHREEGLLFLQGTEQGRAFSFVINEGAGFITAAVAWDDYTVSVFGSCTPYPE